MSWGLGDAVVIPDAVNPAKFLRDHLRQWVGAEYPDVEGYAANLPADWNPDDSPTWLAVFNDPGPQAWPVETNPTLRVVVWSRSPAHAWAVAAYALGQTLSRRVDGLASVLPGTRILDARDTNTGGAMASYTVRTRVRTTLVSE